jgi:hypothetical protein
MALPAAARALDRRRGILPPGTVDYSRRMSILGGLVMLQTGLQSQQAGINENFEERVP